ncbi:MAG: hypothetical protein JRF37_00370 [Deltaproteobacteria bacterium]|nr:hypothetical protein [Deltaproteobacteria bacterium]
MLETWMSIVGASMALAGVPQITRLLKRKKSDDLSLLLWWIILHGQVWWLIYGFWKHSRSLVITNTLCAIASITIIYLRVKYRKSALPATVA